MSKVLFWTRVEVRMYFVISILALARSEATSRRLPMYRGHVDSEPRHLQINPINIFSEVF